MGPFVDQLRRLCAAQPTRAKWVFVPSHAIGRALGDRLVLGGTDWANLQFVTPLDVAAPMGAPFLVERGIDPSEEGLGPALIMRLLLALDQEQATYFRPLAHQPSLAQALWQTMRELRLAGVRAADLAPAQFASAARHAELRALVAAYETFLADHHRGDVAMVYEEALRHPEWCPIAAGDCWTELPDTVWPPLVRRLIDTMPGERIVPETLALPGATIPRRLAAARVNRVPPPASAPLAFLMAPEIGAVPLETTAAPPAAKARPAPSAPPSLSRRANRSARSSSALEEQLSLLDPPAVAPRGGVASRRDDADTRDGVAAQREGVNVQRDASVPPGPSAPGPGPDLFHAGSPEAEIEDVFRRVLASGAPLDDVEIVCASPPYATLVWEKAMRHEWPVTLAAGVPAALTRPGRALVSFAAWIEDDFSAGLLRRLLQSGDLRLPDDLDLAPARAARLLVRAQAAWGRDTYRLSLGRLATSARTRADRDDLPADERDRLRTRAAQADALAQWIGSIVEAVPRPDAGHRIELQRLVACAERVVEEAAARASALDAAAATSLTGAIRELQALGELRCGLDQALRFLRERVDRVSIGADRARPGHLHVSSLAQAAFAHRRLVFVVGLEEGRVFPAPFEDPILLDAEREAVHPDLARATDRTDEAVFAAIARLASISARPDVSIALSYSCRDNREFRQTYASWLMLQALRASRRDPAVSYHDLHAALGAPVSCVPPSAAGAIDASRWWLAGVTRAGEAAGRDAVLRHYPALAAGARAEAARASDRFTEYDGYVPAAGAALDPCASAAPISPTQLEEAAACPFRFFLRRGLRVDAIESGERDRDAWLDPLIRGSLLHDLYAEFLRRCRQENRPAALDRDANWLQQRGREALAALAREMPPPSAEIEERESRALLDDLALFAAAEAEIPAGRTPVGFEVSFGRADAVDDEPLAQADPVAIDLGVGLTFRLAGRIDRIDRIGPSTFEIVDYKTGGYWEKDWQGTFAGGRRLQHALYGLAALELLKGRHGSARVAGAHYYFSSAKGQQERKTIPSPSPATLGRVLGDLRLVIASGLFVHAPEPDGCKWCDFGYACGKEAPARAKAKTADPALGPYLRLVAHE